MKLRNALLVIAAATLTFGVALAQDDRGPGRGRGQDRDRGRQQGGGRDGERRGGGAGGRGPARLLRYDANGDMLVEEAELRAGLEQLQTNAGKVVESALKGIDSDGDGKLNEAESAALREMTETLSELARADRSRDWQLDDEEMSRLWQKTAEECQQHNAQVLEQFDRDQDGKLSDQEAAAAKEAMQRGRGGRDGRGGGRGGDRNDRGGDRPPRDREGR